MKHQTINAHKIYFCRTFHSRFFPRRHAFQYPIIYVGVNLDELEQKNYISSGQGSSCLAYKWIFGYNQRALFSIRDVDYLGQVRSGDSQKGFENTSCLSESIKNKLIWYIEEHKISAINLKRFELVTTPRFFGYAFNPVSFYYCYDNDDDLTVVVLEVNNTFGEKHLYVLGRDAENIEANRQGYDMSFTIRRAFHVSPFNDRKGFYRVFCRSPLSGQLDMRIVVYTEISSTIITDSKSSQTIFPAFGRKKMVALVTGPSYSLTPVALCYAVLTYPLDIFLTMPRILKEAYKLHYNKGMGVFHRPNPIKGTVVKLKPNFIDLYAQQLVTNYLIDLVTNCPQPISIKIHLPDVKEPTIHIKSREKFPSIKISPSPKPIIITLSNYSFFTNFLFNQSINRALLVGFFEKAWECNDLPLLLDFFFNMTKKRGAIFRYKKPYLSDYESWAAKIRRIYLRSIVEGKASGGLEAKKKYDQMFHWSGNGKEKNYRTAIAQNDVIYKVRLSGIKSNPSSMSTAIRDLLKELEDGKLIDFNHIYLLTVPSSGSVKHLAPLITDQLHLLPFPPRYLPYDTKEPIKHPIDHFLLSATDNDRKKHLWMLFIGAIGYKLDSWLWQKITRFTDGPHGNPFITEKHIWEGVIDLLEGSDGGFINESKNFFEQWEVVFERRVENKQFQLVPPVLTNDAPLERRGNLSNPNIQEDSQYRLWFYMKTYREISIKFVNPIMVIFKAGLWYITPLPVLLNLIMNNQQLCQGQNCSNLAKLQCPTCIKLNIPGSFFCSQQCFKQNWVNSFLHFLGCRDLNLFLTAFSFSKKSTHKLVHKSSAAQNGKYFLPFKQITYLVLILICSNKNIISETYIPAFPYTGTLRAVYPFSPRRAVPQHIKKPDYANDPEGQSLSEIRSKQASIVLSPEAIEKMRTVCKLGREVLDIGAAAVKPGVTTDEIDRIVHEAAIERNSYPSPLNYYKFPKSVCTSVNEVICHGIPDRRELQDGDIVNLDVSLYHDEYHGDLNETYAVGTIDQDSQRLLATAKQCLTKSIECVKPGFLYRDLGSVIEKIAKNNNCSVVRSYCGHGIHKLFHCAPSVPHYSKNKGIGIMKPGHVFTIEPMINLGTHRDRLWPDNWTAVTEDGKRSAQFEHTLLVTEDGVEVLTAGVGEKRFYP
ncbi:hypothetical protein G9A89_009698 [Geosiphon pyriformis]|nr:hypothetical protein G9A89_009698 [Geosiphon pyriformis]